MNFTAFHGIWSLHLTEAKGEFPAQIRRNLNRFRKTTDTSGPMFCSWNGTREAADRYDTENRE